MTSVLPLYELPGLADTFALVEGANLPAESALAPDVQAWLAGPEQGLRAAIETVHGAEATALALASLAPSRLSVVAAVRVDRACWAEIARRTEDEDETCLVGLSFDAAGQVSRLVWLRVPLVPICELDSGGPVPEARPIHERYFADLMSSRFAEAATRFTTDTIYSHPPYGSGSQRVLYQGREALWRGFVEARGPSPVRQIITGLWQQGPQVFIQGAVEGIPNGGTFFSMAQITPRGEIARYVAFYSSRRIPGF